MMTSAVTYQITYIIYYISAHSNHLTYLRSYIQFFEKVNVGCLSHLRNCAYIFKPSYCTRWFASNGYPGGVYSLIWLIRGCAAGQSMVFVLSVLDRDYDFVRVCPIYEHRCTIYLIGLVNFVCIPSFYKGNHSKVSLLYCNC